MVCSHLCLFLQSHFGKIQLGRVRVHCCPLHSSDLPDKLLQMHLTLEWQSRLALDSRNLGRNTSIKCLKGYTFVSHKILCLTWQAGSRDCIEAGLWTVEARTAATTLRLIHKPALLTVKRCELSTTVAVKWFHVIWIIFAQYYITESTPCFYLKWFQRTTLQITSPVSSHCYLPAWMSVGSNTS